MKKPKNEKLTTIKQVVDTLKELAVNSSSGAAYILFYDDGSGHINTGYAGIGHDQVVSFSNVQNLKTKRSSLEVVEEP